MTESLLANPIWNALRTEQAAIAEGDDCARRYPHEIGPLAGIRDQSPECYESLRGLAGEHPVALFSTEAFRIPSGWEQMRDGALVQMVFSEEPGHSAPENGAIAVRRLTAADARAMVALADLTEPGPFRLRTLELGNFYGVFDGERLVSMAGKRMHLPGYIEVSGVCTHPDARGRGYARRLMQIVMGEIEQAGCTPFLHAWHDNPAVRLYESMGFALSRRFHLAVLRRMP